MCAPQMKDYGLLTGRPFPTHLDASLPLALAACSLATLQSVFSPLALNLPSL